MQLVNYMKLHLKWQWPLHSLLWEPQISATAKYITFINVYSLPAALYNTQYLISEHTNQNHSVCWTNTPFKHHMIKAAECRILNIKVGATWFNPKQNTTYHHKFQGIFLTSPWLHLKLGYNDRLLHSVTHFINHPIIHHYILLQTALLNKWQLHKN